MSAVSWFGPSLFLSSFVRADRCPCSDAGIDALDRGIAGIDRPALSLAGDIAMGGVYSLAILLDALDVARADQPVSSWLSDLVVMAEAVLLNGAVNQFAKIAARRPRPLIYRRGDGDPLLHDPENYVSFYSGHTSSAFALGLAYAQTFAYRHPNSPWRFAVYAGAILVGSGVGLSRIAAGKHFPTDVLMGAAAGTTFGLLVPWLHRRSPGARLGLQVSAAGLGVSIAFASR